MTLEVYSVESLSTIIFYDILEDNDALLSQHVVSSENGRCDTILGRAPSCTLIVTILRNHIKYLGASYRNDLVLISHISYIK